MDLINFENFEKLKPHFEAFWNKDYDKRCNMSIVIKNPETIFKSKYNPDETPIRDKYLNCDYVYERSLAQARNSIYLGEAFPCFYTNFGTASHCTYFGCNANYEKSTVWFEPFLKEPDVELLKFDRENCEPFEFQKQFMRELAEKAQGQFMVGMNDNCGIIDSLACIRGTDNLLFDLIEEPDFVKAAVKKITAVWKETQKEFFDIIRPNNFGGSVHGWMNTWCEVPHAQIQCDFSVMISPEHFEEFLLPELIETSGFLGRTNYHLDGQEQLRHLDMILSVKTIDNIQWTPVAGQPLTTEFIPQLQRIQKAGKGLVLIPKPFEVPTLLENLSHKGLHLVINGVQSVEEGEALIKMAEKLAH